MGIDKVLQGAVDLLIKEENPYLIVLFGSYAKGVERQDSDLDLAYWTDREPDSYRTFLLAQKLAVLADRDVDLIDLKEASAVLKAQIVTSGKVIYCTNETRRTDFFIRTLKEYALLNEERAVILKQIVREGHVLDVTRIRQGVLEIVKRIINPAGNRSGITVRRVRGGDEKEDRKFIHYNSLDFCIFMGCRYFCLFGATRGRIQ